MGARGSREKRRGVDPLGIGAAASASPRGNARSRGGDGDATRARQNTIGGRDASRARRARVAASNPRRDASAESRDDVDDFRIVRARRRGAIFIRARRAETDAADVATDARGDDEIPNDVRVGGSRRRFDSRARARRRHSAGRRAREGGGGGVARRRRTVGRTPRRRFQGVRGRDGTREIGGVGAPTRRHAVDARRAGPRGDRGCGARGEGEGDARARRSGGGGGGGAPSQFPAVIAHAPSGREQKFLPRVHGGAPRLPRHATRVIRRGDGGAHARRGVSTRGGDGGRVRPRGGGDVGGETSRRDASRRARRRRRGGVRERRVRPRGVASVRIGVRVVIVPLGARARRRRRGGGGGERPFPQARQTADGGGDARGGRRRHRRGGVSPRVR